MAEPSVKPRPWLVAGWPGMGSVALLAAGHLIQQLAMADAGELASGSYFDVVQVEVKGGLVWPVELPKGMFFRWTNPGAGRDLMVFICTAQPSNRMLEYAQVLLDAASRFGIERVVTFASLASGLHPSEDPKVSGVATNSEILAELRRAEVDPLADGEIGGLNGLILGAAASRHVAGMCLLAEIPFFAMGVPNPKAARAALSVFSVLAGIDISLEALNRQAAMVDRALIAALEKMQQQAAAEDSALTESNEDAPLEEPTHPPGVSRPSKEAGLSQSDRARIEELFEEARKDSIKAVRLKTELDRLNVFKEYEGRFLDLFRRGG